jgi:hypothetical protein
MSQETYRWQVRYDSGRHYTEIDPSIPEDDPMCERSFTTIPTDWGSIVEVRLDSQVSGIPDHRFLVPDGAPVEVFRRRCIALLDGTRTTWTVVGWPGHYHFINEAGEMDVREDKNAERAQNIPPIVDEPLALPSSTEDTTQNQETNECQLD